MTLMLIVKAAKGLVEHGWHNVGLRQGNETFHTLKSKYHL
jgi:hypothetical protein